MSKAKQNILLRNILLNNHHRPSQRARNGTYSVQVQPDVNKHWLRVS